MSFDRALRTCVAVTLLLFGGTSMADDPPDTYLSFDELRAPPARGAIILPWSENFQIKADTSIAIQVKLNISTYPRAGECVFQHGVSAGRWGMGIKTGGQFGMGYQFSAGPIVSVFGSGVDPTGDLTDGLDHTITITRDPSGNWASYVDSDTPYATATNTTELSFHRPTRMFDDELGTCHWTDGTVQAVRIWNGGTYTVPSALDNDDAVFKYVASAGY
jgi:hypothetical protein